MPDDENGRVGGTPFATQRGQMIPLLAFATVAILAMAAFAVDVGIWRYQQRIEQSASDAGAVAGAIRLYYHPITAGTPAPAEVRDAAQSATAANGFTDDAGVGQTVVSVNNPPSNNLPPNTGATPYPPGAAVEVIVTKQQPTYFAGIFGRHAQAVSARAVAVHIPDVNPVCVEQLNAAPGLQLNAGNVDAVNCSIATNGPLNIGRGTVANDLYYYGSAPSTTLKDSSGATVAPTNVATPNVDTCYKIPGCNYLQNTPIPPLTIGATVAAGQTIFSAPAPPGYLVINGPVTGSVKFNPGLYYIYNGIAASASGTGVTLVNVNGPAVIGGGGGGAIDIAAPASFGPPDNAPTAGVAFYQPATNPFTTITNNGTPAVWDGLYYAPTANFTSNGKPDTYSSVIIGSFKINGSYTLTVNPALNPASLVTANQLATHVVLSE